jgi:hypothetical protein
MPPDTSTRDPLTFAVSGPAVIRALVRIAAFLAAAHLAVIGVYVAVGPERYPRLPFYFVLQQFSLDHENNLPTFFSSALLAMSACLLFLNARRADGGGRPTKFQWRALGTLFVAMSFDEFSAVHERFGSFLRARLDAPEHGPLHFYWVAAGLPFVVAVGAAYLPFLLALPRRFRSPMILAGAVYVAGALGMEILDGWYVNVYGGGAVYALMAGVEEMLEMTGVILFIRCLLRRLAEQPGDFRILLHHPRPGTPGVEPARAARQG